MRVRITDIGEMSQYYGRRAELIGLECDLDREGDDDVCDGGVTNDTIQGLPIETVRPAFNAQCIYGFRYEPVVPTFAPLPAFENAQQAIEALNEPVTGGTGDYRLQEHGSPVTTISHLGEPRMTVLERIEIDKENGCIQWTGIRKDNAQVMAAMRRAMGGATSSS